MAPQSTASSVSESKLCNLAQHFADPLCRSTTFHISDLLESLKEFNKKVLICLGHDCLRDNPGDVSHILLCILETIPSISFTNNSAASATSSDPVMSESPFRTSLKRSPLPKYKTGYSNPCLFHLR